jgi:hypothetical protein
MTVLKATRSRTGATSATGAGKGSSTSPARNLGVQQPFRPPTRADRYCSQKGRPLLTRSTNCDLAAPSSSGTWTA